MFGANAVTRDTATGLEWLNLTFSTNRGVDEVQAGLGPGGMFAGWRYATRDEVCALGDGHFGLTDCDTFSFTPLNVAAAQTFINLLGPTAVDALSGGLHLEGYLQPDAFPVGEAYVAQLVQGNPGMGAPFAEGDLQLIVALSALGPFDERGSFLVRADAPAALALLAAPVLLLAARRQRAPGPMR